MARYLADTSIWAWARRPERSDIREKLAERIRRDEVVTCVPVMLEAMHRARNGQEYDKIRDDLFSPLERLSLDDRVAQRALQVQGELSQGSHGNHLRPAIDFLIAAIAEAAGDEIVLWAFDKDLRVIAEHTGQTYDGEDSIGPGR